MKKSYVNGRDILPPELLAEVQKHVRGLVWIPSPDTFIRERRELILSLRAEGVPTREVARLAGISVRRVNQIVSQENERKNRQSRGGSGK
jgi:DNA-binding NarL/FixJ family response regulator